MNPLGRLLLFLLFSVGAALPAAALPITYVFAGELGTGLGINTDFDGAEIVGSLTFDDEDRVNTGFDLGYRLTGWNLSVLGGNDAVEFESSGEVSDRGTIVMERATDLVSIGIVEDLTGDSGGRFSNAHSILLRFDPGFDIDTSTTWSDFPDQVFAAGGGFLSGTLQFTGGQFPHAFTDASLVVVPEPGTGMLLMFGLALVGARRGQGLNR
ncbi:MAG: PEP-CTERM sorting domain-containing protein [Myxococcota bacterium]